MMSTILDGGSSGNLETCKLFWSKELVGLKRMDIAIKLRYTLLAQTVACICTLLVRFRTISRGGRFFSEFLKYTYCLTLVL